MNAPFPAKGAVFRRLRPVEYERMRAALATEGLPTQDLCSAANRLFAWEEGGRVLGYAGLERCGSAALLRSVVVLPEHRRSGVGRRLVEAALGRAAALGHREIYLLTTTAPAFFERLGFERVARESVPEALTASAEFSALCPATAVCMRRHIEPR